MADRKPGSGALFPNDKRGNDKAPDMTGVLTAHEDIRAGQEFNIAGWKTKSKAGQAYMSMKASPKISQGGGGAPVEDDGLPF